MGRFPTTASAAWLSLVSSVLENTSRNPTTPPAPMTCKAATHHSVGCQPMEIGHASEISRDPRTKRNSSSKAKSKSQKGPYYPTSMPLLLHALPVFVSSSSAISLPSSYNIVLVSAHRAIIFYVSFHGRPVNDAIFCQLSMRVVSIRGSVRLVRALGET